MFRENKTDLKEKVARWKKKLSKLQKCDRVATSMKTFQPYHDSQIWFVLSPLPHKYSFNSSLSPRTLTRPNFCFITPAHFSLHDCSNYSIFIRFIEIFVVYNYILSLNRRPSFAGTFAAVLLFTYFAPKKCSSLFLTWFLPFEELKLIPFLRLLWYSVVCGSVVSRCDRFTFSQAWY